MARQKSKTKKMPVKGRTIAEEGKIAVEPSDTARRKVAGKTKLPGDAGGSFCRTPVTADCGSTDECQSLCSIDCTCTSCYGPGECVCECGSSCVSAVCPLGNEIGELEQRIASLESLVQVRFGDIEKILEGISLNVRKQKKQKNKNKKK